MHTYFRAKYRHPAKEYLLKRKIPEDQLGRFFYVDKFKRWGSTHNVPRLKIYRMTDLELLSLSLVRTCVVWNPGSLSLAATSTLRYITVMFEDRLKLFGQDYVNPEETVYVTEGPFDSTFIRQSSLLCVVAMLTTALFLIRIGSGYSTTSPVIDKSCHGLTLPSEARSRWLSGQRD